MSEEKKKKARKTPGPRRLEFIPERLRGVKGVESLTTVRQMQRLVDYLSLPAETRPAWVRIGSSVPLYTRYREATPSATFAVDVRGEVSVVRKDGDPRRARLWMSNALRPWNACRDGSLSGALPTPIVTRRIVTLAAYDVLERGMPEWAEGGVPAFAKPDGKIILRAWAGRSQRMPSGVERKVVVEGVEGWWLGREVGPVTSIRLAAGDVLALEKGALWVSAERAVECVPLGFADSELLMRDGDRIEDVLSFLRERATDFLDVRLRANSAFKRPCIARTRLPKVLAEKIAKLDLLKARVEDLYKLEKSVLRELLHRGEVAA